MEIPLGLTFDDVLLTPAESAVLPSQADVRTRITKRRYPRPWGPRIARSG